MTIKIIFWILLIILIYTYAGYAVILSFFYFIKKTFSKKNQQSEEEFLPKVCLFVTAYNEKEYIKRKIENSFALNYPEEKIQYIWITDGSNDGSQDILKQYDKVEVYHQSERKGKANAMNRGMKFVKAPIVIFSDSNTLLNIDAIVNIVKHFKNDKTGCVTGEKRIIPKEKDSAAGSGEGIYWKTESWIKKMDAKINSAVGAVGELFAIRKDLFEKIEDDTILDDFIISLRIAMKGYKIAYSPDAYAEETSSLNIKEELKRKIRISAGGIQTLIRLKKLLNPFRYGILTWQYISHKALRWTLAPLSLFFLPIFSILILFLYFNNSWFSLNLYSIIFWVQVVLYILAIFGWIFENQKIRFKPLFIPFYFFTMNYASILGLFRFLRGTQNVKWEKSKRS